MKKFLRNIEEILSAVCLSVMVIIAFVNVIGRYVLGASLSFTDEATTYLFVLLSLLGAAIAAKRGAHLSLTIILDVVNPGVEKVLKSIGLILAVVFSGSIFYYGIFMTMRQFARGQITAGMQWPEWIFGSFVPIGAFFLTIRFLQALLREIKAPAGREEKEEVV